MSLTPQKELEQKLVAFFFNGRADALRGEMYRALCLFVLSSRQTPLPLGEIVDSVILCLGADSSKSRSLKVVIADELRTLAEKGDIQILENGEYTIEENAASNIANNNVKLLDNKIKEEIHLVAKAINPTLSRAQLETLNQFFLETANLIASQQVPFLTRGEAIHINILDDQELAASVSECRIKYGIDGFIDCDKFLQKAFIDPPESLSRYLYCLYQISVTIQLLAWDPSLEYIAKNVLANLKLYLDTNILFILMQETNLAHQFILSLVQASIDLHIIFSVHTTTLKEYQSVIDWADQQFDGYQQTLRDILDTCKRDEDDPAKYVEGSIFTDYALKNRKHIDRGSWQIYLNSVSLAALQKKLNALSIQIDNSSINIPQPEYESIKQSLLRGSKEQSERKKRHEIKSDTGHDARLFYRINHARRKRPEGELSLGYDTYLLTFDGSLIFFLKDYSIPWTETYFVFPDQWYELSFPFFRMKFSNQKEFAIAVTKMVFSPAFPSLSYLMPLELCKYVFELGGGGLPMGSIQQVIRESVENRLIANVDPAKKDKRKREENELQIKRMIAQQKIEHEEILKPVYEEARRTQNEAEDLKKEIRDLSNQKEKLAKDVADVTVQLERTRDRVNIAQSQQATTTTLDYENQFRESERKNEQQIKALKGEIEQKDKEIASQLANIQKLQTSLDEILKNQREEAETRKKKEAEEKIKEENLRIKQEKYREKVRKISVATFMVMGLLISLALLIGLDFSLTWIISAISLMAVGLVIYFPFGLWSLIPYGIGLLVAVGVILDKFSLSNVLWTIPVAWEIIAFVLEMILKKKV